MFYPKLSRHVPSETLGDNPCEPTSSVRRNARPNLAAKNWKRPSFARPVDVLEGVPTCVNIETTHDLCVSLCINIVSINQLIDFIIEQQNCNTSPVWRGTATPRLGGCSWNASWHDIWHPVSSMKLPLNMFFCNVQTVWPDTKQNLEKKINK